MLKHISDYPNFKTANELGRLFKSSGIPLYLVGGSVRDLINGKGEFISDLDFTTPAKPEAIENIVSKWADAIWDQGKKYGTIGCKKNEVSHEITTFRAERYDPESRKPEVTFGDSLIEDLSRRDFTINAMAVDLVSDELIDPYGGKLDLKNKILKTPLDSKISFSDDPLRMMRAARFIAKLDLTPDETLILAIGELKDRLKVVSKERIRDELNRLLVVDNPEKGLWFLVNTGLSDMFLPELKSMQLEQDPIHKHKDVLAHTIAVVAKTKPEKIIRLAALFHDIGKPKTRVIDATGVKFYFHDVVGAKITKRRMRDLRYPTEDIAKVTKLVELHLRFHTYKMGWTDRAVRRYVNDAGDLLDYLNELTRCDCTTRNEKRAKELSDRMDELVVRIADLKSKEDFEKIRPELDGNQVMEILGVGPSKYVGYALEFLLELRLDEGILGYEKVRQKLIDWWQTLEKSD
jgi:poly(A) polymerase